MANDLVTHLLLLGGAIAVISLIAALFYRVSRLHETLIRHECQLSTICNQVEQIGPQFTRELNQSREQILHAQTEFRQNFDKHQLQGLATLQQSVQQSLHQVQQQSRDSLQATTQTLDKRLNHLTETTERRLQLISGQVDKRLNEGFEKTTATFTDVIKRLSLIDAAQQKITELSSNVVSLQEVLIDKQARGAFGEVQLAALIRNMLPEHCFQLQAVLSNGKRVDCLLDLPEPTGSIAIDAKFPLESYRPLSNQSLSPADKKTALQQFRKAIRKHIDDIADKYIISDETSDGAILFLPAESIFADLHSQFMDLVDYAHLRHVWIVSPTTLMAILTTARAVIKDAATKKQVHIIQEHLRHLAKDFTRFQKRMDNLSRHIEQAHDDVKDVNTSARKLTSRFEKIDDLELASQDKPVLEEA